MAANLSTVTGAGDYTKLVGLPLLDRVAALKDVIIEGGDQAQELRQAPQQTIDALVDAGLFRHAIPKSLGGDDASVRETIETLAAVSAIDGSIGWNLMLGSEINAMAAGGMDLALAKEVYLDNPRVIMCGGGGPGSTPAKAVAQKDGSFKVWGESTFISGCHNAEWCFMAAPIFDGDAPRLDANGQPTVKMWFLHRSQWEIIDNWNVAGLRGSGSHMVKAEGAVVEEKWSGVELVTMPAQHDNPVFRIPVALRLAYNKAACAVGVARGALDAFSDLAQNKMPMLSASLLKDRPIAQHKMGEAEAELRAARAYLFEAMEAVEEELRAGAEAPSGPLTQDARLACIHAAHASMKAVDLVHNAGGTTAAFMINPMERKFRDAHMCASHRWVAHPLYAELGKIFLGHDAPEEFAGG
ncbi:MAG: acyl-CoA dehydrogenase family protein [Pseudomonadales bacterium]